MTHKETTMIIAASSSTSNIAAILRKYRTCRNSNFSQEHVNEAPLLYPIPGTTLCGHNNDIEGNLYQLCCFKSKMIFE